MSPEMYIAIVGSKYMLSQNARKLQSIGTKPGPKFNASSLSDGPARPSRRKGTFASSLRNSTMHKSDLIFLPRISNFFSSFVAHLKGFVPSAELDDCGTSRNASSVSTPVPG